MVKLVMNTAVFMRPSMTESKIDIGKLLECFVITESDRLLYDRFAANHLHFDHDENEIRDPQTKLDLVLVIGGDGTILNAINKFPLSVPIFAVNTGNLGFLSTADHTNWEVAAGWISYHIHLGREVPVDRRHLLHVNACNEASYALNDVVVKSNSVGKTFPFSVYADGERIADYRADGIIVSTPTGSTAYSLSAGGPIVHPAMQAITITPICPHTLTFRPIVLPHTTEITIRSESGTCSIDGKEDFQIDSQTAVACRYSSETLKLIRPSTSYYNIIQQKLAWGI